MENRTTTTTELLQIQRYISKSSKMFFDAEASIKTVMKGLVWRKGAPPLDQGEVQMKGFFEPGGVTTHARRW